MKKVDKKVLKIIKKGFTIQDWSSFPAEIKENELIVAEVVKKLESASLEKIGELCAANPFVIKGLPMKTQLMIVSNDNFRYLSEQLQYQVIERNNNKAKYASEEVQMGFATKNPTKVSFLARDVQKKLVSSNEFFLEFASQDVQVECAREDVNLLCRCSNLVQCAFIKNNPNYYSKCNYEVKRNIIKLPLLSPDKISVETLESYISTHYDNLSLVELENYKNKILNTDREDRTQVADYMNYLTVNINKKRM